MKLVLGAVALVLLTGCVAENAAPDPAPNVDQFTYVRVATENGRTVPCLVYSIYGKPGLSCDWEGEK